MRTLHLRAVLCASIVLAACGPVEPASAARVGQMWGKFVAELRAAPIPAEWAGPGNIPGTNVPREEVRKYYYESLDEASAPQMAQARAAFKTCQTLAQKYTIDNEYSRSCTTWLEKTPEPATPP